MNDHLPDSPVIITSLCPVCVPDADPRTAEIRYCEPHAPARGGVEDTRVQALSYLSSGAGEGVGSDGNAAWCALVHRTKGRKR